MDATQALRSVGGIADSSTLVKMVGRRRFRQAVRRELVVRAGPDRYVLPGAKERLAAAARVAGSLTHLSAAQHWGWKVKTPPAAPQVVVPRGRKLSHERRKGIEIFRGPLDGLVTSKIRTVIDCARTLPFDEALAVADAALNDPDVSRDALMAEALASPRTGRARVVRVVQHADPGADNSFESVLRALCIDAGFEVETQVQIGDLGWCDIADRRCPATTGSRQAEPGAA